MMFTCSSERYVCDAFHFHKMCVIVSYMGYGNECYWFCIGTPMPRELLKVDGHVLRYIPLGLQAIFDLLKVTPSSEYAIKLMGL